MKALASFFLSRDGIVAVATLILLGVVSHFSDPYNPWINLLARVGNVCVFLYILWRAAGKAIVDGLSNRRAAIVDELDSLAVRKAAAEEQLAAMIEKIDSLDAECETILKDSRARGEAIREALVADALDAVAAEAVVQNGGALQGLAHGQLQVGIALLQQVTGGHGAGGAGGEAGAGEGLAGLLHGLKQPGRSR